MTIFTSLSLSAHHVIVSGHYDKPRLVSKVACNLNGSLWINGWVCFNRDLTIQNTTTSIFDWCKVFLKIVIIQWELFNFKTTKCIFYTLHIYIS
jgi:hypothetical protein